MTKKSFRGRDFLVVRGVTHPAYSLDTFEEEGEFKDQYWNPGEGDVVFDVGASYGSYTLPACVMGSTVYAFEPEKTVYDDLVRNIKLNNWTSRCLALNQGLWSEECYVNMRSYAPHWPPGTISSDYRMETLDGVVKKQGISKIDLVKIDVEGSEEHVVKGGLESIGKFKPKLIIECHTFLDSELANKIEGLLSPFGYNFVRVERPPCIMLIATPTKNE